MKYTYIILAGALLIGFVVFKTQSISQSQKLSDKAVIMTKDDIDYKKTLPAERYKILREKGTEKPFSGKYLYNKADGTYVCGACGNPIFSSADKYDSGSGWPSFDKAIPNSVNLTLDTSHNMIRTEVSCAKCGSHLGHVFNDGPTSTGKRFCINSMSMDFEEK